MVFLLPKAPSLDHCKAYKIKYRFTPLFQNTPACTACVYKPFLNSQGLRRYQAGFMDIEIPAASPRPFSHITRRGRHILQLETVLISLYYPSAIGSDNGKDPGGHIS